MGNFKTSLETLEVDGKYLIIRKRNGFIQVNATEMGKPFGIIKKPDNWLRTQPAQDYIGALKKMLTSNTFAVSHICASADLVEVTKGGNDKSKQGTWFHEDIALEYARWLSPEFGVLVNWKFKEYMQMISMQQSSGKGTNYIEPKRELLKEKRDLAIEARTLRNNYTKTADGKRLAEIDKRNREIQIKLARLEKAEFGSVYTLFPTLENE